MIAELFEQMGTIVAGIGSMFTGVFESAAGLIYTSGPDGGFTVMGSLLLIGAAIGLFFFGFKFISKLVRLKGQ